MNLLRFAGKQYSAYDLISVATYRGIIKSRSEKSQEAKKQVIAKTYTIAKFAFEKIRQENRNYQPKSLLEKMLKPIVLSAVNLFLAAQLWHINNFLQVNPVKKDEVKAPQVPVAAPVVPLVDLETPEVEVAAPADPMLDLEGLIVEEPKAPVDAFKGYEDKFSFIPPLAVISVTTQWAMAKNAQ
jgi:hypothetical protein